MTSPQLFSTITTFLLNFVLVNALSGPSNMNVGNIYGISNPNQTSIKQFSTNFSEISPNKVEYFDVYSPPISTRYGEVYWTMMDSVTLPDDIVQRFQGKTISIVGYETDQVFHNNDNGNSNTNSKDISVPITWSYNHHYEAWLLSSKSRIENLSSEELESGDWGINNHGAKQTWRIVPDITTTNNDNIPLTQFFSEGNGGESRGSFHGYASNMAQLLYSPNYFHIQPMRYQPKFDVVD